MAAPKIKYPIEIEAGSDDKVRRFVVQYEDGREVKSREHSKIVDSFTVFPFDRLGQPRYKKIVALTFEGYFGKFPKRGFLTKFSTGYGFARTLAPLLFAIQDRLDIKKLVISKAKPTKLYKNHLVLNGPELDRAFPKLTQLLKEQKQDLDHVTRTLLHEIMPTTFPLTAPTYTKGSLSNFINRKNLTTASLAPEDVDALVKLFKAGGKTLDKAQVLSTKQLIEEFYIEDVLSEMQTLFKKSGTGKNEEEWQQFFKKYNWIFSQFFASPVMLFKDKAYVGGKSLDDSDGKIADFIYKNSLTQNVAIIEIKTHKTALLRKQPYRGTDVFAVSDDLSGAIGQVLNQRDNLQKEYYELARKTEGDFEAHSAKCVVVIGQIKGHTPDQQKAIELFRANSKDVEILTFDEIYERLRALQKLILGKVKPPKPAIKAKNK
jgi:hypothetical protein